MHNKYRKFIDEKEAPTIDKVVEQFSFRISTHMLNQIDKNNQNDPIAKQFIPSIQELNVTPEERADPIGDELYSPVNGIVHRYPDRCLLTPVHVCPVYCRFCFRKEKVGHSSATLTKEALEAAFDYIKQHKEIWEVIITGGDPFILKPVTIQTLIQRLDEIEHVETIRFHTRVPVVEPHRITETMISALKCNKPVYVVLHCNHPAEFTNEAKAACAALVDAGIPMLSQTILLKDINNNIETLSELMRCFIRNRIKPYYLHQGDLAKGTSHFRTSIAEGQALMKQLRGRFSGICQPTYVLDIPGGYGKTPIGPNYLSLEVEGRCQVEDFQGNIHTYPPEM